ncbi:MAG: pyridoxal phosphate-dependent aminotransferase [Flavobacteriales bacterium]|nr:pyridoxal phosphate-dependent aminotransferase [Flavobacteriales bacterium]
MPSISNKGRQMPASPIRRLVPYAEEAKRKGRIVYHLNIGQPDIHTPQGALDAVKNFKGNIIEYSHSAGNESYRKKLAVYYQKLHIPVTSEEVMITTGGSEALLFGLMSCLDEGDEIIIPEPFYANYLSFALTAGARIVPITASIENGFALPPIDEFEKKITSRTKAILICNPSNPTGYLYTREELETLSSIVKKHNLFLFADEVYREFVYDGKKHISTFEISGLEEHLIVVDSISKRYSMCGARIGALLTKNKDVYASALKFAQARLSPPTFGQIAGEAALDTPQSYFDEVVKEYQHRRNVMVGLLNQIPGVKCPNPGGAFYTVAQLPVENAEDFCIWMLSEFEHQNQTVMMAPGSGFYATPGLGKNEVRLAYVLNTEAITNAMECLAQGLRAYEQVKELAI